MYMSVHDSYSHIIITQLTPYLFRLQSLDAVEAVLAGSSVEVLLTEPPLSDATLIRVRRRVVLGGRLWLLTEGRPLLEWRQLWRSRQQDLHLQV